MSKTWSYSAVGARTAWNTGRPSLTDAEVTAIRAYSADNYQEINAVFRDYRFDQPTANWEKYSAIAKLAISGLGKLPKVRGITGYRGDNDITFGGHAGVLKHGATFRLPNFYSTTMEPEKAWGGALGYIFHNKKAGRYIEPFSAHRGEKEILIPPGATFKITGEFHREVTPATKRTKSMARGRPPTASEGVS